MSTFLNILRISFLVVFKPRALKASFNSSGSKLKRKKEKKKKSRKKRI